MIISLMDANKKLNNPNVVFIDTQFTFGQSAEAYRLYEEKHIPGAVYFHLDADLSGPILEHGGRHPIPNEKVFAEKLSNAGIGNDTEVIVYDNTGGATAARCWWLLTYFGLEKVLLLEEPIQNWIEQGYPIISDLPNRSTKEILLKANESLTVSVDNIIDNLNNPSRILIDSRTEEVFSGEKKTKYKKIGHIPGAINLFWEHILDNHLKLKNEQELTELFPSVPKEKEIVVYCGAGVTACANILALNRLGFSNVKLYVGSWGDWCSYDETPTELSKI